MRRYGEDRTSQPGDYPTRAVGLAIGLCLALLQLVDPPLVEAARLRIFDQFQLWLPREPPVDSPVVIVDIDDDSLAAVGQWPWPRNRFGELVDRLGDAGAELVVFDILFADPDRLSPPLFADAIADTNPYVATLLRQMPNNEHLFAAAMRRHPVVLGEAALPAPTRRPFTRSPPPARVAWLGTTHENALPRFEGIVTALSTLTASASGLGIVSILPEVDGVIRRAPTAVRVAGNVQLGLALEALRVARGESTVIVVADARGIHEVRLRGISIPTDRDGRVWLHFARSRGEFFVSAVDILESAEIDVTLQGKIIVVGSSAAGLGDVKVTPVAGNMAGVEIQAQFIESMLTGDFLNRPAWIEGVERFLVAAGTLALAWWGILLPAALFPILLALVLAGCVATSWLMFAQASILVDGAYPAFAFTLLLFWLAMAKYIREEGRRRTLRGAFSQYLSPIMVDRMVNASSAPTLGGERREVTVLFTDIRGFTALGERFASDPDRLTTVLNRYLTAMSEVIFEHGGTIDKYIGDAIMAFWNAPLESVDHARDACLAALGMQARLRPLNADLAREFAANGTAFPQLRTGIGLERGVVFVGNLGSAQRFNYSVIGDAVNVAARLETATKDLGLPILVGAAVRESASDLAFLPVEDLHLKGKSSQSRVFALVGGPDIAAAAAWPTLLEAHNCLLAYSRQGVAENITIAASVAQNAATDLGILDIYDAYLRKEKQVPQKGSP